MSLALPLLRWACTALSFSAGCVLFWAILSDPESAPHRHYLAYVAALDRKLRAMFSPVRGRWICIGQLFALEAVALASVWIHQPWSYLGLPIVCVAPSLWLDRVRVRRIRRLEKQLDGFLLTLANSLRAIPSLGSALSHTQELLEKPMKQELGLALQEMRVGSSVDQALQNLGRRVQSNALNSALLSVLIGRQVGGDLTKVLETTAATLREMARLRGVLESKTAESKAQMWVLALIPIFILLAFRTVNPGYFDPLLTSWAGWLMIAVAVILWFTSLLVARQVLAVKL